MSIDSISFSPSGYIVEKGITLEEIKNLFIKSYKADEPLFQMFDFFNDTNNKYYFGFLWEIRSLPIYQYPYLVFIERRGKRTIATIYKISKVTMPSNKK